MACVRWINGSSAERNEEKTVCIISFRKALNNERKTVKKSSATDWKQVDASSETGIDWRHKNLLEKRLSLSKLRPMAFYIDSEMASPSQDYGVLGYFKFPEVIDDPTHEEKKYDDLVRR